MPSVSDEPIGFAEHIRALFRDVDRESMEFALDLFDYDDVKQHAHAIVARLQDGSMPCDEAWTHEKIDMFERWIRTGMQP